jgi:hypothetical protein
VTWLWLFGVYLGCVLAAILNDRARTLADRRRNHTPWEGDDERKEEVA